MTLLEELVAQTYALNDLHERLHYQLHIDTETMKALSELLLVAEHLRFTGEWLEERSWNALGPAEASRLAQHFNDLAAVAEAPEGEG